jgi:hypothetical protein
MRSSDELIANNASYVAGFDKANLPLPPEKMSLSSPAWTPGSIRPRRWASKKAMPM